LNLFLSKLLEQQQQQQKQQKYRGCYILSKQLCVDNDPTRVW